MDRLGISLPDLGSLNSRKSALSTILTTLRASYKKSQISDSSLDSLTDERGVQEGMELLLASIQDVLYRNKYDVQLEYKTIATRPMSNRRMPSISLEQKRGNHSGWESTVVACELNGMESTSKNVLMGQLGADFKNMWLSQPRNYCIGLMANRGTLTLVLNTRERIYMQDIGSLPFCDKGRILSRENADGISFDKQDKLDVVRLLASLFSLPPERWGLLVPAQGGIHSQFGMRKVTSRYARRRGGNKSDSNYSIVTENYRQSDIVIRPMSNGFLSGRVLSPVGTASFLYKVVLDKGPPDAKVAILKYHWHRKERAAEWEVYDSLQTYKIPNTPKLLFRGEYGLAYSETTNGFRNELLLIEDAGVEIGDYVRRIYSNTGCHLQFANIVLGYIHTLIAAWGTKDSIRILHRDISMANLLVLNEKDARIIDWEYGLAVYPAQVNRATSPYPLTGTTIYMSWRVLRGFTRRSVVDDLESLMYVICHAVVLADNKERAEPWKELWTDNSGESALYNARYNLLSTKDTFLRRLPVDCPPMIRDLLGALYDLLFEIPPAADYYYPSSTDVTSSIYVDSRLTDDLGQKWVSKFAQFFAYRSYTSENLEKLQDFVQGHMHGVQTKKRRT
ncbi:hypothetical protein GGI12_000544 [Dipsacomyces acuminosporus]|nr:hypothetical protein GGI12_000544 [Dipsacomyces acuminosporus]